MDDNEFNDICFKVLLNWKGKSDFMSWLEDTYFKDTYFKKEKMNDIIWLENPKKYEYLRISKIIGCSPKYVGISKLKGEKLIGYTKPICISDKIYEKTIFWLKSYDRGMPNEKEVYGKEPIKHWYKPSESKYVKEIIK